MTTTGMQRIICELIGVTMNYGNKPKLLTLVNKIDARERIKSN